MEEGVTDKSILHIEGREGKNRITVYKYSQGRSEERELVTVLEDGRKSGLKSIHKIRLDIKVYFLMEKGRGVEQGAQGCSYTISPLQHIWRRE